MEISISPFKILRNWLDLPRDVTLTVMKKLDVSEKLKSAQFVCKMWYILCKEPSLWRTLRIHVPEKPQMNEENSDIKMMYSAVDRSNGGLIELDIDGFCSTELFSYAMSRSNQLKRLRLARCWGLSIKAVIEALEKLSSLEELEFIICNLQSRSVISIISSCSNSTLTTFKLYKQCSPNPFGARDGEALAIAAGMPKLCHLELIGNNMGNIGLTAILDGCPLLQSLDLRGCVMLRLAGNLGKRLLENIKDLRWPDESTDDYKIKAMDYYMYDDDYYPEVGDEVHIVYESSDYDSDSDPPEVPARKFKTVEEIFFK